MPMNIDLLWLGHPFGSFGTTSATRSHPVARLHAALLGGSPLGEAFRNLSERQYIINLGCRKTP